MTQRIVLNDECQCGNSDIVHEFNNGDTFKFVYHFSPQGYSIGQRVDLNSFDLTASYWIYGKENVRLDFTKSSVSNGMVIVDPFGSLIKFVFRDYQFGNGKLYCSLKFRFPDPTILGSWINAEYEGFTGIVLK